MADDNVFIGKPTKDKAAKDEVATKPGVKPEPKARAVRLVIVTGPNGGKARRWMVGPPVTTEAYDFAPGVPVKVNANDAQTLLAGVGGRTFVESSARPKSR